APRLPGLLLSGQLDRVRAGCRGGAADRLADRVAAALEPAADRAGAGAVPAVAGDLSRRLLAVQPAGATTPAPCHALLSRDVDGWAYHEPPRQRSAADLQPPRAAARLGAAGAVRRAGRAAVLSAGHRVRQIPAS